MTGRPETGRVGGGRRAAVDIGTNSMRLLIVDADGTEVGRWQQVTGLGRGLAASGRLSEEAIGRTVEALAGYGREMAAARVDRRRAVATSASRDAANRAEFFDRAEQALGVRPELIEGEEEAALSYAGATADGPGEGPFLVVDIGGGSTEVVHQDDAGSVTGTSFDVGSVRLTERHLPDRPAPFDQLEAAAAHVAGILSRLAPPGGGPTVIGVAGTWTSLAAMALDLPAYDRDAVHHSTLDRRTVDVLVLDLARRSVTETERIPSLDPGRAGVILAGAVIAREVMRRLSVDRVTVSEHDLLDGVIATL
jgi:exopolyphosphatase / guanosine-5'-triphosphate,3'-diphosphate pyrophosphatase